MGSYKDTARSLRLVCFDNLARWELMVSCMNMARCIRVVCSHPDGPLQARGLLPLNGTLVISGFLIRRGPLFDDGLLWSNGTLFGLGLA
jgi:hypothetical protein